MNELKYLYSFNDNNWEKELKFKIFGVPGSKQSMRHTISKSKSGKTFVQSYQSKKVVNMEASYRSQVVMQLPLEFIPWGVNGHIEIVEEVFVFPVLKSFTKKKMKRIESGEEIYKISSPDLIDNLNKPLLDALQGVVFLNDKNICKVSGSKKIYGLDPHIFIHLRRMDVD